MNPFAPHVVAALVTEQVSLSEIGQIGDVLRAAASAAGADSGYSLVLCAPQPGTICTREGYQLQVPNGLDALSRADTVLLPGCWPVHSTPNTAVLTAVRTAHHRGARIVASCTGVTIPAAAGLLDGRTAAVHWRHADDLARTYPDIQVSADILFVDHGDVATTAGHAAGLDLYLHLIRVDHGDAVAEATIRHLVSRAPRASDRPQVLTEPLPPPERDVLPHLLDTWARHLDDRAALAATARHAGLSERTLRRRFHDQLGTTPGRWLLDERLRHARLLLENTDLPVEAIAHRVGLASATALRRQFRRELATTPTEYRTAARHEG